MKLRSSDKRQKHGFNLNCTYKFKGSFYSFQTPGKVLVFKRISISVDVVSKGDDNKKKYL